eukprot:2184961-Pleurochrysis_carterae.AAC.2
MRVRGALPRTRPPPSLGREADLVPTDPACRAINMRSPARGCPFFSRTADMSAARRARARCAGESTTDIGTRRLGSLAAVSESAKSPSSILARMTRSAAAAMCTGCTRLCLIAAGRCSAYALPQLMSTPAWSAAAAAAAAVAVEWCLSKTNCTAPQSETTGPAWPSDLRKCALTSGLIDMGVPLMELYEVITKPALEHKRCWRRRAATG